MNCIASIDFSINSTCVCILTSEGYVWHHFGREKTSYFDLGDVSYVQHLFPKRVKREDYCSTERAKLHDARILCLSILHVLEKNNVQALAFEGHSFNSKGNSLLELVSYQFLLRNLIIDRLNMGTDTMFFYSPITVKSFAGGARFKKKDMLTRFIECEDPLLKKNPVFDKISLGLETIVKGDDVMKPIDDLVDSYWILKKLQQDV